MTVQEMIDELMKVEDKTLQVVVPYDEHPEYWEVSWKVESVITNDGMDRVVWDEDCDDPEAFDPETMFTVIAIS